jgi:hypothetical protein
VSKPTIVAAAILVLGSKTEEAVVWTVTAPGRHNDVIHKYVETTGIRPIPHARSTQGFLTSDGRFVTRQEAAKIAALAGQTADRFEALYSEDLW